MIRPFARTLKGERRRETSVLGSVTVVYVVVLYALNAAGATSATRLSFSGPRMALKSFVFKS